MTRKRADVPKKKERKKKKRKKNVKMRKRILYDEDACFLRSDLNT